MALIRNTNDEKVWRYLKTKGLSDHAVAGVMGNLMAESGLRPNNLQDTGNNHLNMTDDEYVAAVDNGSYSKVQFINDAQGFGIAQWTYWTRKKALYEYVKSKNKSIGDLEAQIEFFFKELTESFKSVYDALRVSTSVFDASNIVLMKYESPADQSVAVQKQRASIGQGFYDKYAIRDSKGGDGIMSVMTYSKTISIKLSDNFSSHEFNCHGNRCCSQTKVDPELVNILQQVRDHFGKPVKVTSGFRCYNHNKSVGGATSSYHAKGMAADITVEDVTPREVAKFCESIGVKGIGLYETAADGYFVHVDTRTNKYYWYGQAQLYRSTFGGTPVAVTPPTESQNPTTQILMLRGSKGTQVKAMQEKLIALGYDLGVHGADGDFGQMTDIAVRSFQAANGLVVDGKAGQKTLDALDNAYEKADKTVVNNGFKVKILASVLHVRSGAGMNYPIIGKVKRNSVQTILEEKDGWGRIANGWISSSYYQKL